MNTYTLATEHRNQLQEFINTLPEGDIKTGAQYWLGNAGEEVTEGQLNSLVNYYFQNTDWFDEVQKWSNGVKG